MKTLMNKLNSKKSGKKGFTLMEMLIVVAIIAILVAIAIPTMTNALTKAKIATDEANLRAYYSESIMDYMLNETALTEVKDQTTVTIDGNTYELKYGKFSTTVNADKDNFVITYTANNGTTYTIPAGTTDGAEG